MGFAVHGVGGFLVGSLDQAEGLARGRVEPVLLVRDSVLLLNLHVLFMRTLDRLRSQAIDLVMNIHVQRHHEPPQTSQIWGLKVLYAQRAPQTAVTDKLSIRHSGSRAICLFARKTTTVAALLSDGQQVPESSPGHHRNSQSPGQCLDHRQTKP